jgi:uncharacterized protein GlcG (DUF336 family)
VVSRTEVLDLKADGRCEVVFATRDTVAVLDDSGTRSVRSRSDDADGVRHRRSVPAAYERSVALWNGELSKLLKTRRQKRREFFDRAGEGTY